MTTKRKGQTKRKAGSIERVTQLRFFWRGLAHGWTDTLRNWEERLDTDYERCRHFLRKTTGHLQTISCPRNDDYRCPRRVEQNDMRPGVFSYQAVCGKRMEPENEFEEYCDTLTLAPEQVEFWQVDREDLLSQIGQAIGDTDTEAGLREVDSDTTWFLLTTERGEAVYISFSVDRERIDSLAERLFIETDSPFLWLCPGKECWSGVTRGKIAKSRPGSFVIPMNEVLGIDPNGRITLITKDFSAFQVARESDVPPRRRCSKKQAKSMALARAQKSKNTETLYAKLVKEFQEVRKTNPALSRTSAAMRVAQKYSSSAKPIGNNLPGTVSHKTVARAAKKAGVWETGKSS